MMEKTKECEFCGEEIKASAVICRYCRSDLKSGGKHETNGELVQVRLKAGETTYIGDIFVPEKVRLSDVINDARRFVILSNAMEEKTTRYVPIGFLAINKTVTEWIELQPINEESLSGDPARLVLHSS